MTLWLSAHGAGGKESIPTRLHRQFPAAAPFLYETPAEKHAPFGQSNRLMKDKAILAEYQKEYYRQYISDPEIRARRRATQRQWYAKNREHCIARNAQWRRKLKEAKNS